MKCRDYRTVLERVEVDEQTQVVVARVRPKRPRQRRCGVCGRRATPEDEGSGQRRRWRVLDLGTVQVWLEADAPRVRPDTRVYAARRLSVWIDKRHAVSLN